MKKILKLTESDLRRIVKRVIKEGHGSSYMAKSQLFNIARKAQSMYDMLEKGEPLDDWMESHIAKMDSMMDSVSDSFTHDQHEEKQCPKGMYWCKKDQVCKPDSQKMDIILSDINEGWFSRRPKDDELEKIKLQIMEAAYSTLSFGTMTKQGSFINGVKWAVNNLTDDQINYLRKSDYQ